MPFRWPGSTGKRDLDSHAEPTDLRLAQFMHNELDAFFYTISHPNTMMKFATFSVRGARFVPLSNIERLTTASPYYSRSHIPIHLYSRADNTEAVETIGINAVLLTSASVSDEVVYAVTKAIFEDLDDSNDEMLRMLDPDDMLDGLAAPHPRRRYEVLRRDRSALNERRGADISRSGLIPGQEPTSVHGQDVPNLRIVVELGAWPEFTKFSVGVKCRNLQESSALDEIPPAFVIPDCHEMVVLDDFSLTRAGKPLNARAL